MNPNSVSLKEQRRSVAEAARGPQSQGILMLMIFMGLLIGGLIERSCFPDAMSGDPTILGISLTANNSSAPLSRRYCDPPNATVLLMYENYDEEASNSREQLTKDYDFSQWEEMDFQVKLSPSQEESHKRWRMFLWGALASAPVAAWMSALVGPGRMLGLYVIAAGVIGLSAPTDASRKLAMVAAQGFLQGGLLPTALLIAASSVSDRNRDKYIACLSGNRLGFGIGELMPHQQRNFTICIIAITWFVTWVLMVRTQKLPKKKIRVPWRKIAMSRVLFMSAIALFGTELLKLTTSYALRQYLDFVLGYSNRLVFAIPEGIAVAVALICAFIAQHMRSKGIVSKTTSRRIFVYISHFFPAGMLFLACFVGCNETTTVVLFALAIILEGCAFSGAYSSVLDVSPTFASVIVAVCCSWGAIARLLPVLMTSLVFSGAMPGSWRSILCQGAAIGILTAVFFMLRGSSRPPHWSYSDATQQMNLVGVSNVDTNYLREKFRMRTWSTSVPQSGMGGRIMLKRASIS